MLDILLNLQYAMFSNGCLLPKASVTQTHWTAMITNSILQKLHIVAVSELTINNMMTCFIHLLWGVLFYKFSFFLCVSEGCQRIRFGCYFQVVSLEPVLRFTYYWYFIKCALSYIGLLLVC